MNAAVAIDKSGARPASPDLWLHAQPPSVKIAPLGTILPAFAAEWDDLAAHAAEPNVFAERWFIAASAPLHPGSGVRLVAVRADGGLIGILPVSHATHYGRLPLAHVENWLHYHSFLGGPLLRRGYEQAAWTAILDALDTDAKSTGLLHFTGLVEGGPVHQGLLAATAALRRSCHTVHRIERALLESDLSPEAYYTTTVRKKKRKELGRLQSRLAELGTVTTHRLNRRDALPGWIDTFLALEQSGWKGRAGSALGCTPATAAFFRDAVTGAFDADKLEMIRLDLNDRPIAVLVNFLSSPGSFSFKTAFDEDYARFSPGVLIQLENLHLLARNDIRWMDSCASENHPMINSLWGERRGIVRVTLPLAGWRSHALFHVARAAERAAAAIRNARARRHDKPETDE